MSDWLVADILAPDVDDLSLASLYAGAAGEELCMPFCSSCGSVFELEQEVCDSCAEVGATWRPVSRSGRVHAATVVHRREPGLIVAESPYAVIDVELDSGHRIVLTTTTRCEDAPAIDAPVSIGFRRVAGVAMPAVQTGDEP